MNEIDKEIVKEMINERVKDVEFMINKILDAGNILEEKVEKLKEARNGK